MVFVLLRLEYTNQVSIHQLLLQHSVALVEYQQKFVKLLLRIDSLDASQEKIHLGD